MASQQQAKQTLSRDELMQFFDAMITVFGRPETKQRVANGVTAGNALAVTTQIQREVFEQLGIGSKVGMDSLATVRTHYHSDLKCMLKYLRFAESEELIREEAELGSQAFQQKRLQTQAIQEQQLTLLRQLRKLPGDVQEGFLHGLARDGQGVSASTFFSFVKPDDAQPALS